MDTQLEKIRHTASHVMAQAVLELFPDAKLAIGPAIEEGFYYDFDLGDKTFSDDDLKAIEKKMKQIVAQDQKMEHYTEAVDTSIRYLQSKNQPYKLELAEELKKEGERKLSFYTMIGPDGKKKFTDLCKGPHVARTKAIGAFKLQKIAGAYWRGDEKNKMLQRIYGTAFATQAELEAYLERIKQAEERDHRKLGVELDLFTFSDLVGGGLPLFTPRGTIIRNELARYLVELQVPKGYQQVNIPHLAHRDLYITSGHWEKFADDIFHVSSKGEDTFVLKPMNCPHHTQIYASRQRSYRELPIRYFDITEMYRDEKPGQLHGLMRVRSITIDDAHCFCRLDQVEAEANLIYDFIEQFYRTFGFPLIPRLSLHDPKQPDKYLGGAKIWKEAESKLRKVLKSRVKKFEEIEGEAAFYGPKIDFEAEDAIGRQWQLATIQLDFNLPERFQLEYIDEKGQRARPVMIHRAIAGSFERFMAILIESYAGAFPLWLAPIQVQVLSVSDDFADAAQALVTQLAAAGIRAEGDLSNETVGKKIRTAEKLKVPYMLVVGEKEANSAMLSVRVRGQKEVISLKRQEFIERVKKEIAERR
ncbi:MAG: threonine--tRNA ligase [Candidatus Buchananbacteria bacterium RIFCSPLOWO2_01_FULL_56_15]|uniref:Threonine--tRNA ligase n=2 Tax=Candidatus Buchananiibacteriota TaxID=1817903 RepID=A0A1G1YKF7_9BACT|nr:MAG: threonine--tRNA ligase [Candidatus Buchananbacteria bacterium RIFCSPHIGHO2_02_FULL_56_16]OGY54563.1 MAG: threonine--tRNA ligase [Candidatus Buchananbacteria bacterium RIFCSPLOWO2_01_FULL_56_15]